MVQRQQNLADLIADDMGNLRPGAIDLINRANRAQPIQVNNRRRRIIYWVSLVIIFILFLKSLSVEDDKRVDIQSTQVKTTAQNKEIESAISSAIYPHRQALKIQPTQLVSHQIDHGQDIINGKSTYFKKKDIIGNSIPTICNYAKDTPGSSYIVDSPNHLQVNGILGMSAVFGYNVNIRELPQLGSPIIRQTNQGETFQVKSYTNGWYQILTEAGQRAYIFGAYLIPIDFKQPSLWVGLNKNRTKLLLTKDFRPNRFQIIMPDGTRNLVNKKNVQIVNK